MMGLLSPWRDANEFWLLLGLGLFAAAFPFAWGVVLGKLFGPLTLMVLGAVLRSVSFEFRIRASQEHKARWVMGFCLGSIMTALGQGMALGRIATGFQTVSGYGWFTAFVGLCAVATYVLLGAACREVDGCRHGCHFGHPRSGQRRHLLQVEQSAASQRGRADLAGHAGLLRDGRNGA